MFSVDNFYMFMRAVYGQPRQDILLFKHAHDGSKDIRDIFGPFGDKPIDSTLSRFQNITHRTMILHDQEPFMRSYIDTYRNRCIKENYYPETHRQMYDHELFLYQRFRSCYWPIFCHSEKNSDDIKWLEKHKIVTCHYLWHGMISRDWFRHWKHHPDLNEYNTSWNQRFLLYARGKDGTRIYRNKLLDALNDIKHNIKYDWNNCNVISSEYSATIDVSDAKTTAIHLVAETVFDQNKIHLTEKTFKPMVMNQPFIIFAGAGSLEYLQNYGFKTFGDIWDESYDFVVDHKVRFDKIINLIKDLNSMPEDRFRRLIHNCQKIVDYNREYFFSEKFESILLKELHDNVKLAIEKQNDLALTDPGGSFFHVINNLKARNVRLTPKMQQLIDYFLFEYKNQNHIDKIKCQYPWFGR